MGVALQRIEHKHCPRPVRQCSNGYFKADLLARAFSIFDVDIIHIEAVLEVFLLPEIAQDCIGGYTLEPTAKCAVAPEL